VSGGPSRSLEQTAAQGRRGAFVGLLSNAALAVVKLVAGLAGNSYALVADAIESAADVVASLVVLGGLRLAARDADDDYPFGYGRAEPLAAAAVALMLLGAAFGIAWEAAAAIRTPHSAPAAWTLGVLLAVIIIKQALFRRQHAIGQAGGSPAVQADAWHHLSDAVTSGAAFVGIAVSVLAGPGWEAADDWAALVAALVIAANGVGMLRPAVDDLMDRAPEPDVRERILAAAHTVPEVRALEKLKVRRVGTALFVDLHVQADPALSLHDAHIVSGCVKTAIRRAVPVAAGVLIHMEPFDSTSP
jgi:cation diffusion facilitator family transporter